jgi:hypothetical protein
LEVVVVVVEVVVEVAVVVAAVIKGFKGVCVKSFEDQAKSTGSGNLKRKK